MKNLVMSFATNMDEKSVRVFCASARRVYGEAECDIVIITNKYEPYFLELNRLGVTFFETPNNYSKQTGRPSKVLNRAALYSLRAINGFPALANAIPEISASYRTLLETWHHPTFARWFGYSSLSNAQPPVRSGFAGRREGRRLSSTFFFRV